MKGVLLPDHIPVNNAELIIQGMPRLLFTKMSGIEEEIDKADLPDRTAASGGHSKAFEFTASQPIHHRVELAAMTQWWRDCQEPVAPNYKKNGTLVYYSISTRLRHTAQIIGVWVFKRKYSDYDMSNAGDLHEQEWTFSGDMVIDVPGA